MIFPGAAGIVWMLLMTAASILAKEESAIDREEGIHPIEPTGLLFFGYGDDEQMANHYFQQCVISARRIKALNPTTNITVVTNPGKDVEMDGTFDMVIHVEQRFLYSGRQQAWGPPGNRQWLTRLEYLSRSPYEVTLALDSQALCCAADVNQILNQLWWEEFDMAFAVQGPRNLNPHNWAIMYRLNFNTRRLFKRWRTLQVAYSRAGSDQLTLYMAAGSLALQGKLNVGVLAQSVAMATVIHSRDVPEYPKSSTLVDPRPIHFVHYDAQSLEDEEDTCKKLNKKSDRARVVLLPNPYPTLPETNLRAENIFQVLYSEDELAAAADAARKGAPYFKGLDWGNVEGKWGQAAIPWRDQYFNCWEVLAKDVNLGVRHIYNQPKDIWNNTHFAEEFIGDTLEWPEPHGAI